MKTVMKKMFCLMLVAVLMVGALPFQAFATEEEKAIIDVNIYVNNVPSGTAQIYAGTYGADYIFDLCYTGDKAKVDAYCVKVGDAEPTTGSFTAAAGNVVGLYVNVPADPVCGYKGCTSTEHAASAHCTVCDSLAHAASAHCTYTGCSELHSAAAHCTYTNCPLYGTTEHTNSDHCTTCGWYSGHDTNCATTKCDLCGAAKHTGACCTQCGGTGHKAIDCKVNPDVVVKFFVNGQLAETKASANAATVKSLIDLCTVDDNMRLHYSHATVDGATVGLNDTVPQYKTVYIYLVEKAQYNLSYNINVGTSGNTAIGVFDAGTTMGTVLSSFTWPARSEFNITGWYWDAGYTQPVYDNQTLPSNHGTTIYPKWTQKVTHAVTLKIYTNGNTSNVVKVLDMYYAAQDGKITEEEVRSAVKGQIKANNNAGLSVYGPFDGNGWSSYCANNNYKNATGYVAVNKNADTYVYVMAHNAELPKTNNKGSKADSTNPKTGDMILMPAAVLGLSASSLAVMYYLDKKKRVM